MLPARIGAPLSRIDGRAKVTGAARYAADFAAASPLHGHYVLSTIGRGRITGIDTAAAEAIPGVRKVYTYRNRPALEPIGFFGGGGRGAQSFVPLGDAEVPYYGAVIGFVVAETLEAAREASKAVRFTFAPGDTAALIDSPGAVREEMPDDGIDVGDVEAGFAEADVTVEADYETPAQMHNAMELFACTAAWNGDRLTIHEPSQWVYGLKVGLAEQLAIPAETVHVVNPYVGGAFGGKGSLTARTALCALAAREFGRPVKLVVTREEGFTEATFRAETRQRVRLGAKSDGTLTAVEHSGTELTSRADPYMVNGADVTVRMYASPNIRTRVAMVHADRQTPGFMRAPAETPYFFAMETAMDELARKLAMDPVALRLRNDTMTDPVRNVPFSSRSLRECYAAAGEAFGWADYSPAVGAMRDGDELVGWGVATSTYPANNAATTARVRLSSSGDVRVEVAAHDVGTGAYTVFAQAAAARLGVSPDRVAVLLGDTDLPPGPVAGGSVTTGSVVSCIEIACGRIRERLGAPADGAFDLEPAFRRVGLASVEDYAEWKPAEGPDDAVAKLYAGVPTIIGGAKAERSAFSFGAQFVEVRINRFTREIRVPRIVGAFAAGRILNEKTAKSQLTGGMIWGVGSCLHEACEIDPRTGAYVNDNIAEYLVPVNADIREIEAILVPEVDTMVNPAGVKGIGEIAIVGTGAAISNAVFHATGIRARRMPIRIEDILPEDGAA